MTLSWSTSDGDAGSYTATVASEDDSDSTSVTVEHAEPTITEFTVQDNSDCVLITDPAQFEVSWETEYTDDQDVTVTLPDGSTESGTSGTVTYSENGGCGEDFTFDIVAENEGGSDSDSRTVTAG